MTAGSRLRRIAAGARRAGRCAHRRSRLVITSIVLLAERARTRCDAFAAMVDVRRASRDSHGADRQPRDDATTSSAVAVAIGFRMNLFNIGVDGQYRLAAFVAAAVGGAVALPGPLHIVVIIAGRDASSARSGPASPALLKVTRGVSEVISTIMLNFIADRPRSPTCSRRAARGRCCRQQQHRHQADRRGRPACPGIPLIPGTDAEVYGFVVARRRSSASRYWFAARPHPVRLRPAGHRHVRAGRGRQRRQRQADGDRHACCISGAVAGLVGMPAAARRAPTRTRWTSRPGSASPASRSRCSAATTRSASRSARCSGRSWTVGADPRPRRRAQGDRARSCRASIVLSVVVAYELVRRYRLAPQQRRVGRQLRRPPTAAAG